VNEMDELARMRASVPAGPSGGRAQNALLEAIRAEQAGTPAPAGRADHRRGAGPLRPRRAILAGGLSLTVAAGLTAVLVTQSGPAPPAAQGLTVAELSYRSAAAAEATPPVPPGQWIYSAGVAIGGKPSGPFQVWTTADDSKAAWLLRGKLQFIPGPLIGLPIPIGDSVGFMGGPLPVAYGQLGSLPRDPRALERFLAGLPIRGFPSDAEKAFDAAGELLESYRMPPRIAANLLRAVGLIPGVTAYSHFIDTTGRPGVGFLLSQGSVTRLAIVMDPHTFAFRTYQVVAQHPGQQIKLPGPVVQRQELVSGPGVVPPADLGR